MARLIDADALAKAIGVHTYMQTEWTPTTAWGVPIVDAEPVKHGHWTETYDESQPIFFKRRWACSSCGRTNTYGKPPFCMYCGAKMDEVKR